jgi:poly(3-hydroxybutyrate) depolymerase
MFRPNTILTALIFLIGAIAALALPVQGPRRGTAPVSANAQKIQSRSYLFKETNTKLEYALFVSTKVKKGNKAPLVIALHGANVSPEQMISFVVDEAQSGGYVVAAPTGYSAEGWYGVPGRTAANVTELSEKDVMAVLDLIRQEFNVDEHRIYLLGQSMGGAGALFLGVKYHQIWAAVAATAPAASTLQPSSLEAAKEVPMILVQGDADQSVSPAQTRRWADTMHQLNMTYQYYEVPGGGHRDAIIVGAGRVFAFFDKHTKI